MLIMLPSAPNTPRSRRLAGTKHIMDGPSASPLHIDGAEKLGSILFPRNTCAIGIVIIMIIKKVMIPSMTLAADELYRRTRNKPPAANRRLMLFLMFLARGTLAEFA